MILTGKTYLSTVFIRLLILTCRSQWPRGLRCSSTATCMLKSWVLIPPGAWMSVCCECCVLSGRGLCDELITRPEETYRPWCVVVCDLEKQTSCMRRPRPTRGLSCQEKNINKINTTEILITHKCTPLLHIQNVKMCI